MYRIHNRKNVIVSRALNNEANFPVDFNLNFDANLMKVKFIHYFNNGRSNQLVINGQDPANVDFTSANEPFPIPEYGVDPEAEDSLGMVYFDFVNDFIGTFTDNPMANQLNTDWAINGRIGNHSYNCSIRLSHPPNALDAGRGGVMVIHLEFLQVEY